MRGKSLMIQGTASSAGKSLLCAALLRIFAQEGLRCAPFKAQNMSNNAFVTAEGLEMGRAQVLQAQAAGIPPRVCMNPILLKPLGDRRSQVLVDGRPVGNLSAMEYQKMKPALREHVRRVYEQLEAECDLVVLEGAGSPAEINLREGDLVNMGMAEMADAPVLLVGDIDLGGVFASLLGTVMLLEPRERARIRGVVINKFRGDLRILEPGLRMLEDRMGIPVLGVIPYLDLDLEDEDGASLQERPACARSVLDVAVVRLAHMANFTDLLPLTLQREIRVRYITRPGELEGADLVILPGTRNTGADLLSLRQNSMSEALVRYAQGGGQILGICGGYQMLGKTLRDPEAVETGMVCLEGLGLLDMDVVFSEEKKTAQSTGVLCGDRGWTGELSGLHVEGYEIHSGRCTFGTEAIPWLTIGGETDGVMNPEGNVMGCHLHGLLDDSPLRAALITHLGKTAEIPVRPLREVRERELDRLACVVRESLDMEAIREIIRGEGQHA